MFEYIPQELKFDGLWCCWKKTDKGKIPFDVVKGCLAKSNDKNTFYSFKTILNYLPQYLKQDEKGAFLGGLGLGLFNGFSAIDIDSCIDENGVISEMAQDIIDYCQSYTEKSPSGTGIRIIFKSNINNFDKTVYFTNNHTKHLEVYLDGHTNKFVTITGNALISSEINKVDIQYILDKYMRKKKNATIEDFIEKDKKLKELWNSYAPGSGANESELDLALCSKLAYYLKKDKDLIEETFKQSPYYQSKDEKHKDKWERDDYRLQTIEMAITNCFESSKNYLLNDTGNAHRFVDKYSENIKYNVDNNKWMIWNGQYWQFDVFNNIKNYAEMLIEEMKIEAIQKGDKEQIRNVNRLFNSSGKEAMLKEAQHLQGVPVINDMFDKNDYLLNCGNGVINLHNGEMLAHNKDLLLNKISGASLSKKQPKLFIKFLNEMFLGDQDLIHYLHKAFGYSLTGDCREQCMFILVGDGNDGKSLLLQIIQEVIGDYSCTSSPDLLLDKKTQTANLSEVARLKGIRYCVVNELKMGDKLNEAGVKDITSGNNKIVARFLYCNEFEFLPKMKIWLATNYEPRIIGTDKGIWRRIVKIPCKNSLNENEVDKELIYNLREEKDEILGWLLEGCLLWQKEGLKLPKILEETKKEYKEDQDVIQQWLNEYCETNIDYACRASDLFENFKNYCQKNNEFPMSQTLFGRNFSKKFAKARINGITCYKGVRLKNAI